MPRVHRAEPPEPAVVSSHRVVDPRPEQHDAAQRAEGREHHERRHDEAAAVAEHGVGGIGRHAGGRNHRVEGQHVQVHDVQRDVAQRDDGGPDHQGSRDGLPGVERLACHVGHHVPPAEGEQPCRHRARKPHQHVGRLAAAGKVRELRSEHESGEDDREDRQQLAGRERRLEAAAESDAEVIDGRENQDGGNRRPALFPRRERHEVGEIAREDHGNGRDDPGVHAPEHRPGPEKPDRRRERFGEEHVDAAGPGKGRRQFRADQRSGNRQKASERPRREQPGRRRHRAAHLRGLHEDRRADDGADDHRGGVRELQGLAKGRRGGNIHGVGMLRRRFEATREPPEDAPLMRSRTPRTTGPRAGTAIRP